MPNILCMMMYTPAQSAYNMIERVWSHLSKLLEGLVTPPNLPEEVAPAAQNIPKKEQIAKLVFENGCIL